MKLPAKFLFLLLAAGCFSIVSAIAVSPPQLKFTVVANVTAPVQVTHGGDGSNRLFVATKSGSILIYQSGQLLSTPFLNISSEVSTTNEQGLFSIAFPPDYSTKKYFYVSYSRTDGALVLSRFTVPAGTPNVATPGSEQVLLVIPHSNNYNYGGQIAFGPDGYLYFGVGDGGPAGDTNNNSQNLNTLLGKILRLDTESGASPYAVPSTNPFVNMVGKRAEIWASGLHNPRHFSFDRSTGDLYLPDAGQNSWEELNFQAAGSAGGKNYGWRILEGTHAYNVPAGYDTSGLTPPVIEYAHQLGTQIAGGFVYRGPASRLSGLYLYMDVTSFTVWGATNQSGVWSSQALVNPLGVRFSSFGEDEAGQLYAVDTTYGKFYLIEEDLYTPTPKMTPSGTFNNDQNITVASNTAYSAFPYTLTFRYTTDGSEPAETSPVFPNPLVLSGTATIKVKAFSADFLPSATVTGDYTFKASTPTISSAHSYVPPETGLDVIFSSSTSNAVIHYTLDGSTPTTESPITNSRIHLSVGPATVRVAAFKTGYTQSDMATANFTLAYLATPSVSPAGYRISSGGTVILTGTGAIHYTLDGSTPTESSPLYTNPFTITEPVTLKVQSFQYGYYPSTVVSSTLYLYDPEGGTQMVAAGSVSQQAGYVNSNVYSNARFNLPEGICIGVNGNMYIADTGNHSIRQTTAFGPVNTLAGNGTVGFVNENGGNARFSSPRGICRDSTGNLYVADDGNHVIRKIDTSGNVSTYAGSGISGSMDGPGTQAQFLDLQGLALDAAGNLYVGSLGVIRKVDIHQNVSTFATLPNPGRVSVAITPAGLIFATDSSEKAYQVSSTGAVSLYAGGIAGTSDGFRTKARFQQILGIASDVLGILYLCETDTIRKIQTDGMVTTVAYQFSGSGTSYLYNPTGIAVGNDGVAWIADTGRNRILSSAAKDWDDDGISDANEGGSTAFVIGVDDRKVDSDGDGQSNSLEFQAGTNPLNPQSHFDVQMQVSSNPAQVTLQWPFLSGRTYQVYYSDDLVTWTPGDMYNKGPLGVTFPTTGIAKRFYKVSVTYKQ